MNAVEMNDAGLEPSGAESRIRAVDRVCDILDVVAAQEPVSLADIASACGLPKTSAFRYLATLQARRYVDRVGDAAEYRLGLAMLNFQSNHFDTLVDVATPRLHELRDEFGETANLGVLTGTYVSYLAIVESRKSVRLAARPEDKDPVHCTALGKAIISQLPDQRVHGLLGETYERMTYRTLTTWEALQRELERVRANGFAVDDEENELGGRCVAVAIPGPFQAAISLSAPVSGLSEKDLDGVAQRLKAAADKISAGISSA
ncbi:MAG TPA: IclR family transcriptional regulator [Pseudolysinimonas sp.]|nr:IclR family transcriptional regulator [Pseudolysinimonas sp.]